PALLAVLRWRRARSLLRRLWPCEPRSSVGDLDRYSVPKGVDMPKVVITHAVEDIDRWLQGKEDRTAAIESGTGSNVTDYVAQDGSTNIAITADVADVDAMK